MENRFLGCMVVANKLCLLSLLFEEKKMAVRISCFQKQTSPKLFLDMISKNVHFAGFVYMHAITRAYKVNVHKIVVFDKARNFN